MSSRQALEDNFYKVLFNPGEATCFGYNVHSVRVSSVNKYRYLRPEEAPYITANPLIDRRLDASAARLSNIVIESDFYAIDEWAKIVEDSKLPWSTCTFSGTKSLHFIIALGESLPNIEEYKALAQRVYSVFGGKGKVDISMKNPSRFTRRPFALRRQEDGTLVEQTLLEVRGRVQLAALESWLVERGQPKAALVQRTPVVVRSKLEGVNVVDRLPPHAQVALDVGAPEGDRWRTMYMIACEMVKLGAEEDEVVSVLEGCGHFDKYNVDEMERLARDAARRVYRDASIQLTGDE